MHCYYPGTNSLVEKNKHYSKNSTMLKICIKYSTENEIFGVLRVSTSLLDRKKSMASRKKNM
jgi:hypothetical protein